MVTKIFDNDWNAYVFDEHSSLSSDDLESNLKFNSLDQVRRKMEATRAALVIAKPLVESHRVHELLDYFPSAKVMWMYRHYRDVVNSNLKRWGSNNGVDDLRPIVNGCTANWRSRGLSDKTRQIVKDCFSETMSSNDAAALFWYSRNTLYFDQKLPQEEKVFLCKYENLVLNPQKVVKNLYRFQAIEFPGDHLFKLVSSSSVGKGNSVKLSPHIFSLCEEMVSTLDAVECQQEVV
jgi:hypothetical protein